MDKEKIFKKFGKKEYLANNDTFVMGIHHLLRDHIAQRFEGHNIVLDACCGSGFMSISLAKCVNQVIAVDINSEHLEQAENNAKIAGVYSKINFIIGDILDKEILKKIPKINAAFLDPDWAIMEKHKSVHVPKLSKMQPPADKLFSEINKRTQNITLRLPREIDLSELKNLPPHEFEKNYLDNDFKFYCAYFGKLIKKEGDTEFRVLSEK